MDAFFENAAGIVDVIETPFDLLSLMVIALVALVAIFFYLASEKIKMGVFVLLLAGISAYAYPVLQMQQLGISDQAQDITIPEPKIYDKSTNSISTPSSIIGKKCTEINPSLECLWIQKEKG